MKRNRFTSRKRISADATELSRLAIGLAESGSKLEDMFWQNRLGKLVDKLFHDGAEDDFTGSLDRLFDAHAMAHDDLADTIEAHAESCVLSHLEQEFDILLFTVPLLAWSRFSIPTVMIPRSILQTLKVHLGAHVFAAGARLALADYLYSPDQLPHSFTDTWQLMQRLGTAAMAGSDLGIDASGMPETNRFLSDTRYLVGALAVRRGQPLFRWNEADKSTRESALKEWVKQGGPCFEALLTGCSYEPLLADAYHAACRAADSASRPYSLKASVAFLQATLGQPIESLRAVIGGFHDKRLEEYRIGFGPKDGDLVFHGVVWPLLGIEDENTDVAGEIETALRKSGLKDVVTLDQQFPYEFCDDCGAPLYPNIDGDTVHAEMPEQNNVPSQTLH
ncbi:MAG TPA: DUF2863 family protein [Accumulibacter sp.]|uniref:DUF2863 family protein n=2 Tax=Candidatus Accumulibacter TaxID=327159 RepID=A0A080M107_9PROT|nr:MULTISPECIES: DUF2863 family protein [Candidatus Accumulibacter]KFB74937.1 MAG: hypothetical protein AW06_004039 [Candidatus Accumulibacter cognatus]MBN8519346.1 DUF2863 family protein [Accumulibacter sp.]MBO3711077.1 DUF2863 family protein [Accumulibacter sp.]MCC2866889.1 DUF2863 family protein [Candidatus Accumulibacter phosphatis]MCM8580042.1 DUF2863 family protein [Accumulibacter sp.]